MGRFGDVLLVGGEADLSLEAKLDEVVRLYLTNTANTRVVKVALPGARMKLVGGDSGHVEHEELVEEVILAPSERVVVDVQMAARITRQIVTARLGRARGALSRTTGELAQRFPVQALGAIPPR